MWNGTVQITGQMKIMQIKKNPVLDDEDQIFVTHSEVAKKISQNSQDALFVSY